MAVFLFKRVRNVIEKAVSICVIIQKDRKVKNSTLEYKSFEDNSMKIYDQQRLESVEEKKAAHMQPRSLGSLLPGLEPWE